MTDNKPGIEGKVWAGGAGTTAGAVLSAFIIWLLGVTFWGAPATAGAEAQAVTAVPLRVAALVGLFLTVGGSMLGGYLAKHTPRLMELGKAAVINYNVAPQATSQTVEAPVASAQPDGAEVAYDDVAPDSEIDPDAEEAEPEGEVFVDALAEQSPPEESER